MLCFRFVFALLDSSAHREAYLAPSPVAAGRALFPRATDPAEPYAAVFKIDDGRGQSDRIGALARAGFVITSNTDSVEADDAENSARRAATLAAGSHFVSSDFAAPVEDRDYWLDLVAPRCNPVTAAADCEPAELAR